MLNKNLILIVLVVLASGCGTELRTYVQDKPRVGIDLTSGNAGCVYGKCPAPTISKPSRRTYVFEFTRPVPESEVKKIEEQAVSAIVDLPTGSSNTFASGAPAASNNAQAPAAEAGPVIPVIGDQPEALSSAAPAQNGGNLQAQTYIVQKDDTLQKISKKVFGTFSKWYKIYQANKEKISNPNVLKPGTVLNIPDIK